MKCGRLDERYITENVRKILRVETPTGLKMLAIKGTLPLRPIDYIIYLYQMMFDENAELRDMAIKAFSELPDKILGAVVSQNLPPEILHKIAITYRGNSVVLEKIIINNATADETIETIATFADEKLMDIIVRNQVRYLRYPKIIKAIVENPNALLSQKSLVVEFAGKSKIDLNALGIMEDNVQRPVNLGGGREIETPITVDNSERVISGAERRTSISENKAEEGVSKETALNREDLIRRFDIPREFYDESITLPEDMEKRLIEELEYMPEERQLAIVEVGRHRIKQIMVKSSSSAVALAVVKHPEITLDDIFKIAQDRTANAEAIKYICNHRDYSRVYNIKLKLALNPKTPVPMAMAFVRSLRLSDLKNIAKNNSISKILQNTAKGIMKMHS